MLGGAHICGQVRTHAEARGGHLVFCSMSVCIFALKQALSLNLELGWQPENPNNPPFFTPHPQLCWGYKHNTAMYDFLHGVWGFELGSSCLCSKHSNELYHLLKHNSILSGL